MNSYLLFIFISFLCVSQTLQAAFDPEKEHGNVKILAYTSSVREIVNDLVANWNSPLVYLKDRGYLKAPIERLERLVGNRLDTYLKAYKGDKDEKRVARSFEEEPANDLGHLFRTLFSSSDTNASDKIKSKLDVPWDMNALKNSVRNEAHKFYEKFYDRRNQQETSQAEGDTDIDRQVAQLYPSVICTTSKEHPVEEQKKAVIDPAAHKEPRLINGIAKLLSSRAKPLPLQLNDQKNSFKDLSIPAL